MVLPARFSLCMGLLGLLGLCLLSPLSNAVDSSKFRTCEQGSFCRRYRKFVKRVDEFSGDFRGLWRVDPGEGVRHPDPDSNAYSVTLVNRAYSDRKLNLTLSFYLDGVGRCGIVRAVIDEVSPLFPRFKVAEGDVTVEASENPSLTPVPGRDFVFDRLTADTPMAPQLHDGGESRRRGPDAPEGVLFHFTNREHYDSARQCHYHLEFDPFRFIVFKNGKELVALNNKKLLNFEVYRKKPKVIQSRAESEIYVGDAAEVDASELWEESFHGKKDSKPRGPAAVGMDMSFSSCKHTYGLGGHSTTLDLPNFGEPYRGYNSDVFEYEVDKPTALYGNVPFLMAVHYREDELHRKYHGRAFLSGVLWVNPSETFTKVDTPLFHKKMHHSHNTPAHAWFLSESGRVDLWLISAIDPHEVMYKYHAITGWPSMPPLWALGKHQSRWNYNDEADLLSVNRGYDDHDISLDVLWLDIEHTQGKKYFTWNSENFPHPQKMIEKISADKRKTVTIVDPHIKVEEGWSLYDDIKAKGLFTKQADGIQDFVGMCWPGDSAYPDFTNPEMRSLWASQFSLKKYNGSTEDLYTWNDMNEPSVFNGPEGTMPRDALHLDEEGTFSVEHRDLHNIFGMYVHRASYEGQLGRNPNKRPFVLSRSFYAGSHRYGPVWTGDNLADIVHMVHSVPMLLALALSGMSFAGADVPGFFKNPSNEIFIRWHQLAALAYPFYRAHAHLDTKRREPWTKGPVVAQYIREAVQTRYQLLPLWYTLFLEYAFGGRPVIRPLWFDHLDDPKTFEEGVQNTHIMLGDSLLIKAVAHSMEKSPNDNIYLPDSDHSHDGWFDFNTNDWKPGGMEQVTVVRANSLPIYARAGTIIPKKLRRRKSTEAMIEDPYTLMIYCALDPAHAPQVVAKGRLFIDDGASYDFHDGKFLYMNFDYKFRTLKSNALGIPAHGELGRKSGKKARERIFGNLDHWPKHRLRVEKIIFVGSTIAPERVVFYDSYREQDLLFQSADMGLSHPPRFHIIVKNPPIELGRHDWRIELQGIDFKRVRKHLEMTKNQAHHGYHHV